MEGHMEAQELHRGRLIDHIQLVVRDLEAAQKFYTAIFEILGVPLGGAGEGYFWADELFVSTADSPAALGVLTGRHHLAFQARSRGMVEQAYQTALAHGGRDNGAPGERDRKSTRLNSSHVRISYAVFCLKKKKTRSDLAAGVDQRH